MSGAHPLVRLETLALVAVGGFAGSNFRYFLDGLLPGPRATLLANAAGSLVLGLVLYETRYAGLLDDRARLVFATGFLASLTTYSTFAVETVRADPGWALANVLATHTLGIAGVLAGRALAARIEGEPGQTRSDDG
jgi:CrcB protein